jgi:hypothetical protein
MLLPLEKKLDAVSEPDGPPYLEYVSAFIFARESHQISHSLTDQMVTDVKFPTVCQLIKLPNCSVTELS